jgi:hypothetical protein
LEHFGHLTGTDPNADPDNDGASNLEEWIAGTDPLDGASALRISAPANSTNGVVIQWPSVAGRYYRLERSTNLVTGFDFVVRTNIAATPPLNSEVDRSGAIGPVRYYRVELEP